LPCCCRCLGSPWSPSLALLRSPRTLLWHSLHAPLTMATPACSDRRWGRNRTAARLLHPPRMCGHPWRSSPALPEPSSTAHSRVHSWSQSEESGRVPILVEIHDLNGGREPRWTRSWFYCLWTISVEPF
jgi:hypothetical protein